MRLIDADALPQGRVEWEDIVNAPIIDAVPVVRCGDCKRWKNDHLCESWSRYGTIETRADQFCSYGEKKQ